MLSVINISFSAQLPPPPTPSFFKSPLTGSVTVLGTLPWSAGHDFLSSEETAVSYSSVPDILEAGLLQEAPHPFLRQPLIMYTGVIILMTLKESCLSKQETAPGTLSL